jgi:hypothetical protein
MSIGTTGRMAGFGPELVIGTPPTGWAAPGWSPSTLTQVSDVPPDGSSASSMDIAVTSNGGNGGAYAAVALQTGKTYRVFMWVKPVTNSAFTITLYSAAWSEIKTFYSTVSKEWQGLTEMIVSPGDGGNLLIYATGTNGAHGEVSAVSVREVINP